MTTLQQTAQTATGRTAQPARRAPFNPLVSVALGAALVGGIVGGTATAVAAQTLFTDQAAERARIVQFAEQLKYALRWDDLHRQMYPYAK